MARLLATEKRVMGVLPNRACGRLALTQSMRRRSLELESTGCAQSETVNLLEGFFSRIAAFVRYVLGAPEEMQQG